MIDAAFLETLRAAEAGEGRFPEKTRPGLAGDSDRLLAARNLVFAEGEGIDTHFENLVSVAPGSPLVFCADRLRLLRKNRTGLKKAFEKENELTGPLFHALAAGPGPTLAKRNLADSLTSAERIDRASDLRRALSERAYPVYVAERAWLKHIGPSRRATKIRRAWLRWKQRIPFILIGAFILGVIVFASFADDAAHGGSTSSGSFRFPFAIVIWPVLFLFRMIGKNSRR